LSRTQTIARGDEFDVIHAAPAEEIGHVDRAEELPRRAPCSVSVCMEGLLYKWLLASPDLS
jgi:hypothetical protein